MSLCELTESAYDLRVKDRGAEYYLDGRVEARACRAGVHAAVEGSAAAPYEVVLHVSGARVRAWCSCPFAAGGEPCKHMWAVSLASDADGLVRVRRRQRMEVDVVDGIDGEAAATPAPRAQPRRRPAKRRSARAAAADNVDVPPAARLERPRQAAPGFVRHAERGVAPPTWRAAISTLEDRIAAGAPVMPSRQAGLEYTLDVDASERGIQVQVYQRYTRKDGTPGGRNAIGVDTALSSPVGRGTDRPLLETLSTVGRTVDDVYFSPWARGRARTGSTCTVPFEVASSVLPRLLATGRCGVLSQAAADAPLAPLAWDDGTAWRTSLALGRDRALMLTGALVRGEERVPLDEVAWAGPALAWVGARIGRADAGADIYWKLLRRGAIAVPATGEAPMLQTIAAQPERPLLALDQAAGWSEHACAPVPRVRFARPRSGAPALDATVDFSYEGCVVAGGSPGWAVCDGPGRRLIARDPDAERAALDTLAAAGLRAPSDFAEDGVYATVPAAGFPAAARALIAAGWIVEADGRRVHNAGGARMRVRTGTDWFEVDGSVEYDGMSAALPALLAAARRGDAFVALVDGSHGLIPEAWLGRTGALAGTGVVDADVLRFSRAQAGLIDAMLEAQPEADVLADAAFRRVRDRLRSFSGVEARAAPRGFVGSLRGYQREAVGWFRFLEELGCGGCLADDMGLGKTVQILALLERRRTRRVAKGSARAPSLVVVPRSLVFNWINEAARFTPRLRAVAYTGSDRAALRERLGEHDLVVTTYGLLRRDIEHLAEVDFDYVILDEAQAIKNASSQAAKACRLLRASHRLALTGTPVENHLGDVASIFDFLNPGMLGSRRDFQSLFAGGDDPEAVALLSRVLRPFVLRRTKQQVLADLPEKTVQTLDCELDRAQRREYDELLRHYRASIGARIERDGAERSAFHVLEALLRLRQAACHPGLIDGDRAGGSSAKLEVLLEQLREVVGAGHKALVFSQFTTFLGIVRDRLTREGIGYEYLDGQTRKRESKVERFQTDAACKVFLISLKAGGYGLNLTAADYVFLLDPWWNPAVEAQAIDRTHRIGQTRPVFAYRLVARDTVEEKVMQLQADKRRLAEAVISDGNASIRDLTADDLRALLA